MSLSETLQKDIVTAMKAKDELRLSVLRMVKSALQLKEVEKLRALDDAESIQLLQTLVKQRKESIEQFTKGGRQDLVDKETRQLAVVESYLPARRFRSRNGCRRRPSHCGYESGLRQADGRGRQSRKRNPDRKDD